MLLSQEEQSADLKQALDKNRKAECLKVTLVSFFKVLFVKWVLTMFDMIDAKDQLRAIYGFIFNFVTDENLVCFKNILI